VPQVVRVSVTVSGGLFGAPRPMRVDAAKLGPADGKTLEGLVDAVMRKGASAGSPRPGSEVRQYDVEITSATGGKSFTAHEGGLSTELKALIDWVSSHHTV
jgi:hypothetical protein